MVHFINSTLIHGFYAASEIKFDALVPKSNIITAGTGNAYLTKANSFCNCVVIILLIFFDL